MKNEPLKKLYDDHISRILAVRARCDADMEGPYLISPSDAYWNSPIKVAVVGQQTGGWTSEDEVGAQMEEYAKFNLGEHWPGPFWNVVRNVEKALTNAQLCSVALNLNRFDQEGVEPSWENQVLLSELDFLLVAELRILDPNIVIFFTGPKYDDRLFRLLDATGEPVIPFIERQLCRLRSDKVPALLLRTYHPNYLRRSGLEDPILSAIREVWCRCALSP